MKWFVIKKKAFFMISFLFVLFIASCGQDTTSIYGIGEQPQETVVVSDPDVEAEEFAEKIVYYMSNAECDKLYMYLYTPYKEGTTEGNFTGVCNYFVYELSFKLDKITKIEDDLYATYINIVSKDYFETMEIIKVDDGFEYKFFDEYLGFANLREFCNARRKLNEGYDYCVQHWGKANQDESACNFMGADYKVASCKSVVKASMGE